MITKTALAAAIAAALAAQPVSPANAGGFGISLDFGDGYISFGDGDFHFDDDDDYDYDDDYTCWEAKQKLKWNFKKVHKVECYGMVYTFKVKKKFSSSWKTVKFHKESGNYWYA